jgi:hypothetical protein
MPTTQLRNFTKLATLAATVSAAIPSSGCGGSHSGETSTAEGPASIITPAPRAAARTYEAASVLVPAGASCLAHPPGNLSAADSIPVHGDADGVARFLAVRPTLPAMIDHLDLDCTNADGSTKTYVVDLRSDDTFAPRPFDPSRTGFALRPALTGDPLSYTEGELVKGGYGLRPDPEGNPDGYARWLAAASIAAYKIPDPSRQASYAAAQLSSAPRSVSFGRPPSEAIAGTKRNAGATAPVEIEATVTSSGTAIPWTGAILGGSYQKNATAAQTFSYLWNEATFNVPDVFAGYSGYGSASVWNGLDNVFQAVVGIDFTPTGASYWINHQCHIGWTAGNDNGPGQFTPAGGDSVYAQEWYCDAEGNKNLSGGYACTAMTDITQNVVWDCTVPGGQCPSYTLKSADLKNGFLGQTAEYVVENDTAQVVYNQPSPGGTVVWGSNAWPDFPQITMTGRALVVQGSGAGGGGQWVTTTTDPSVQLAPDWTSAVPSNLAVSLKGTNGVQWSSSFPSALVIEGKCMGVPAGTTTDGTPVQIEQCNGGANQEWILNADGSFSSLANTSSCLDLADSNTANGTAIDLWHCNGGKNQQWGYSGGSTNELKSAFGGCIDNPDFKTANGTPFQYHTCNDGVNQQFVLATTMTFVLGDSSSLGQASCLDLPNSQTANGTQLDVWGCNGGNNQLWLAGTDGSIRTAVDASKCVDLKGGNTANGTPIQIYNCNGTNSQIWYFPSYTLTNEVFGGCIDDPAFNVTNGTLLQYFGCNGGSNQSFYVQ